VNLADAVHEKARRHFLEDDAADAEPDGLDQGLVVDHGRQEHHARRQALATHLPQDGDAVGSGHAEIQDQDVRAMLRDGAQRFDAIGAAIDHVDVRLAAQKRLEAGKHDGMVIGDDDCDALSLRACQRHGIATS
jgi:hypothetical protein